MKCRRCEGRAPGAAPRERARSRTVWGADRISGLRCSACGTLLDADDIAKLLLEKQSQLERFGLLTPPSAAVVPIANHATGPEPQAPGAVRRKFRLEKD
jgi:hypothetical protein